MSRRGVTPLKVAFRRPWPSTLRGLVLWLFGVAFIIMGGFNYIATDVPQPTRTYLSFALNAAPAWVYGMGFIVVGSLAALSAYCHFGRDRWGYLLTSGAATAWGGVYVCGLFYGAPLRTLGGSVVWLLFAAILTTCARIPHVVFSDFEQRE